MSNIVEKFEQVDLDSEAGTRSPNGEKDASEVIIPSQAPSLPGPGILTIRLYQALGLGLVDPSSASFRDPETCRQELPYAVLECDRFQVSADALCWSSRGRVIWESANVFKFDVSASSDLTLYLFIRSPPDASGEPRVTPLGSISLNPFLQSQAPGEAWVDIQNGIGRVNLEISYLEEKVPPLGDGKVWHVSVVNTGDLVHVEKQDNHRNYAMVTLPTTNFLPSPETPLYSHRFITRLKFALESPEGLHLLSPLASGGHLFGHLQRERRFAVDKARFYAAELVCLLEYLHDKRIVATIKPENILIDALGHISLCTPGLFGLDVQDGGGIIPGTLEYPAPELLLGHAASRMADWWTLGVLLHEMLTGLPPFYHKDADEKQKMIIGQGLQFPDELPSAAEDVLIRLLNKDPAKRLGVGGVSEVTSHPFFYGIKWNEVQGKNPTPFKPSTIATVFPMAPFKPRNPQTPRTPKTSSSVYSGVRRLSQGFIYERVDFGPFVFWQQVGPVPDNAGGHTSDQTSSTSEDDVWDVLWQPASQRFNFKNRLTSEERAADVQAAGRRPPSPPPAHSDPTSNELPSQGQAEAAFALALELGCGKRVISKLVEHGVNLNAPILKYEVSELKLPLIVETIPATSLDWAVEHDKANLVNLFLDMGADPNITVHPIQGPALVNAVRRRNLQLVEILVRRTNRVSSTRSLGIAVDRADTTIVDTLLANGVRCDFEESDRPRPRNPYYYDHCTFGGFPELEVKHFIPPLVRAVQLGNADLVRALLAHGASANVSYHDLTRSRQEPGDPVPTTPDPKFSCGRVAQLAMELGYSEIVQLLLDSGADIHLAQPSWPVPGHTCKLVLRTVYLEVTAGLEAEVAIRAGGRSTL
ncbi:hypothetical protein G7Z17_g1922 [Cylindrodendrum hubeiense]|uniref:Protein kinase domain-containing protein n=1 Tax=Cylindrodendrum hubeiense TaxID=595255 RepID=A0A9P5HIJ2_9HYPO|nr:hypothetical protein G7Z17_g1922 [Cylindrodendrum hubeiense]